MAEGENGGKPLRKSEDDEPESQQSQSLSAPAPPANSTPEIKTRPTNETRRSLRDQVSAESQGQLSRMEKEIKHKARPAAAATKPGAVSTAGPQLTQMEADIRSKTRTSATATRPGVEAVAGPQLSQMESEIKGKTRSAAAATKPGAVSVADAQLNQMESDVIAKNRANSTAVKTSKNVGSQLRAMEDDMVSKRRSASAATNPGAVSMASRGPTKASKAPLEDKTSKGSGVRARLHQMEADTKAKNRNTLPASTPGAVSMTATSLPSKEADLGKDSGKDSVQASNDDEVKMENIKEKTAAALGEHSAEISMAPDSPLTESFEPLNNDETNGLMSTDKSAEFHLTNAIPNIDNKVPEQDDIISPSMTPPTDPPVITTADHGVVNAPQPQYGVTGYSGPSEAIPDEELAVAIAITDEDDDVYYQNAVEFDPDSKPPLLKNRRFRLYASLGISVCLMITALVIATIILLRENPTESVAPTSSPTKLFPEPILQALDADNLAPKRNIEKLVEQLRMAVGDAIKEQGSIENLAARWLIYEDPLELYWHHSTLIQRYLLALFYFKTTNGGASPWRSCNRPNYDRNETDACLHQRFNRQRDDSIKYINESATRWLSGVHECKWVGCVCDDNKVIRALNLVGQNMTGPLPTNLVQLPLLQSIRVAYNSLTGTLPSVYASMRQLLNLEIHGNKFKGTFPEEYFKATSLQNLNIGDNEFTGTLSADFSKLTNLKGLHTFSNYFTGTIPPEVFNLEYLSFTRHSDNIFEGTIPNSVGKMSQLQEIWLSSNQLSGSIPTEVGKMTNLIYFKVNWNKLTGAIPTQLYNAKYLMTLDVFSNYLTGTLDDRIGDLTDLKYLYVSRNQLEGNITTRLVELSNLNLAWLHMNRFVGDVPKGLCKKNMEILQADCFPRSSAPNKCECCSACCNRNTEMCLITDDDLELEFI